MNKVTFKSQIESLSGPCGLLYFIKYRTPKYSNISECRDDMLKRVNSVNELDPMQFHGYKTQNELEAMVDRDLQSEFDQDQAKKYEICKVAVEVKNSTDVECMVESDPDFVSWDLSLLHKLVS